MRSSYTSCGSWLVLQMLDCKAALWRCARALRMPSAAHLAVPIHEGDAGQGDPLRRLAHLAVQRGHLHGARGAAAACQDAVKALKHAMS